ncbi:hypothetical protein BJ978_001879 [Agromyces terreus]|uniref:Uncharacterized protein n=1 Tax=Agromyces terreus TaxID=424795 RepID=A0A9X2H1E0_9MICO|nr:hypothetical protein [Agromyces terreus]
MSTTFGLSACASAAFTFVTMTGSSRYAGTTSTPLSYCSVSLTSASSPAWSCWTISIVCSTRRVVSLLMVEYCSPGMIDSTDSTSES